MNNESWACNCVGPQNGEPYCPCMMNRAKIFQRNGHWIEPEKDLGHVSVPEDVEDILKNKQKQGYKKAPCNSVEHNPPTHLYVPPGETYVHTCPACGEVTNISPLQVTYNTQPDDSIIAPEFTVTTESFEPYSFSDAEDEDAFSSESNNEVIDAVSKIK